MSLEEDFPPEPPDKNSAQMTFQAYDILSREPSQAMLGIDVQNCEILNGCCFKAA